MTDRDKFDLIQASGYTDLKDSLSDILDSFLCISSQRDQDTKEPVKQQTAN